MAHAAGGGASFPPGLAREPNTGRYPTHRLKRVDEPTIRITDEVQRVDERDSGFNRALRGDLGESVKHGRLRFVAKYPLSAAMGDFQRRLADIVDGPVAMERAPIPEDPEVLARHVKQVAYFLRADVVGICRLPEYAVYSHDANGEPVTNHHENAIGILIDQNYESFAASTGHDWISNSQSFVAYSTSGTIACMLADYIRRLGYPARAHHARSYQVVVPPILLHAGLGEMSRIGSIVVNPFLGPRFKAAVVTTDLPLAPDKPIDFGLQHFCTVCKKCARECPSGSITDGEKTWHNGYEIWKPDMDSCTRYRVTNARGAGCAHCIKVCPWSKSDSWHHTAATALARRSGLARRALTRLDDILGYGRPDPRHKWWFDVEDVDGRLVAR